MAYGCPSNFLAQSRWWMQAKSDLVVEQERHQSDLQVRFALHNGQVETADSQPLTDQSDMLLLDRFVIDDLP